MPQEILCPLCDTPMRLREGKRGRFYGCSRFPNCLGTRDYVVYPENHEIKLVKGTPEQEAIWDYLQNGTGNVIVQARAGVGKSFTLIHSIARLRGIKVGVFSFNNHIIKELNEKLKKEGIHWAKAWTFNSFGNRCVKNFPALRDSELFKEKVPTLLSELVPDDTEEGIMVRYAAGRLVDLCKAYMDDGKNQEDLLELMDRFNIDVSGAEDYDRVLNRVFEAVPKTLELCLNRRTTYDYNDQIWWTVKMRLPAERFDMVMIDESQDTNKMQQDLIRMICP